MSAMRKSVPVVQAAASLWLMLAVAAIAGEPFRQIKGKEIARRFQQKEFTAVEPQVPAW